MVHSVMLAQSTNYERNLKASSGGLVKELLLRASSEAIHIEPDLWHSRIFIVDAALTVARCGATSRLLEVQEWRGV